MNYSNLRYEAVIDFVEIEIHTTKPTNPQTVLKALRKIQHLADKIKYVKPLNAGAGGAASIFRFRIQDPKSLNTVKAVAQVLQEFVLKCPPSITTIEIAFDTYCKGASLRQLAEIVTDRYRFSTNAPNNAWHFYKSKIDKPHLLNENDTLHQKALNKAEIIQRFESGWQLADIAKKESADVRFHAYVKTHDDAKDLPKKEYRARFEVTLQGAALPCKTLEELARIDFTKLADRFKFRKLSDDLHPAAKYALTQWSGKQFGRRGKYRRKHSSIIGRHSGSSIFRGSTIADDQLNATIYGCLRKLTREWRSKRVSADFPSDFKTKPPVSPHKHWNGIAHSNNVFNNTLNNCNTNTKEDSLLTDKNIIDREVLRTSPFNVDNEQKETSLPPESALQIRHDLTHATLLDSLFPELFNSTPELEAEQERISKLINYNEAPPFEAKS